MISNFISVATSATSVSYYIFIIGVISQVDFPFFSAISFTSLYNVEELRLLVLFVVMMPDCGYWLLLYWVGTGINAAEGFGSCSRSDD